MDFAVRNDKLWLPGVNSVWLLRPATRRHDGAVGKRAVLRAPARYNSGAVPAALFSPLEPGGADNPPRDRELVRLRRARLVAAPGAVLREMGFAGTPVALAFPPNR